MDFLTKFLPDKIKTCFALHNTRGLVRVPLMKLRILFAALFVISMTMPGVVRGNNAPHPLGSFGGWKAFSFEENKQPVCYMLQALHFSQRKTFKRGIGYVMITHRPSEGSKDVFSYTAGYTFKPESDVKITIGKKVFDLFTQNETAWSRDGITDHALAAAMRASPFMKVTGVPAQRGLTPVTDTVNLRGAAAAYQAIGKACGYPDDPPQKPAVKKPAAKKKHK